jgi:beta-N-acetylhexosaminidase
MVVAQMIRQAGIMSIWLSGLVFLLAGANIYEPYLISLRGFATAVLPAASIVVFILLIKRGYWSGRGVPGKALVVVPAIPVDAVRRYQV